MPYFIVAKLQQVNGRTQQDEVGAFKFAPADLVKSFFTREDFAQTVAQQLAAKNPQTQYAVFEVGTVYETSTPTIISKKYNAEGELVVQK